MQLVTAIIQPFMLDRLARALRKQNISGYSVTGIQGSGWDISNSPSYLCPRIKVEIIVNDNHVEHIKDLIVGTVSTHQEGDGIVYATPILSIVNIQTGQNGPEALMKFSE